MLNKQPKQFSSSISTELEERWEKLFQIALLKVFTVK